MKIRRGEMLAVMTAAMLVLAACTPSPGSAPVGTDPEPSPEVIAEELDVPWSIAFHEGIALVSERDSGRVAELGDDGAVREVAVIDDVTAAGEGGLLGLAVLDGDVYTYFTAADGNRIERRAILGAAGALALGPPTTVIDGIPAAGNHNGGRIAFGPDGMLYVAVGDAGDRDSAQDLDALSGKILRLTPDGAVPDDNPFEGSPVYSYGHRNPQGIAWDDEGTMYASEFGQDTWDELNVIEAGGNYGWPVVEGVADDGDHIDPVQQWAPSDASPSGIAVVDGRIVIANLRGERLRVVPLDDLATASEWFRGGYGRLRDAVVAPDGSLWVLTNNTDGRGDPADGDDRILRLGVG
ncbi:PQQ-dependent sugar dehydrogenase [Microbacterium saperdae]|uniref:Glucose/arabinose dehydrogenase n=1 Tax=Microbacterium saperdae TaxID=69368 RepID=A0A543BJB4_9MICO|nr:PQQ-dependent sugar dehydrogenase [Microbacterium saperdae]TQL84925.1 glucose/arabinose dehydrogenase [Microbacterium saperdae]GGM58322.1 oxidoreductase [Microbacterium saperdae]